MSLIVKYTSIKSSPLIVVQLREHFYALFKRLKRLTFASELSVMFTTALVPADDALDVR